MFEQQLPKQPSPSSNQPQDIFASTDPVAQKLSNASGNPNLTSSASRAPLVPAQSQSKKKMIVIFLLVVVVVGVAVGGIAFFLTKRSIPLPETTTESDQGTDTPNVSNTIETPGLEPFSGEQVEYEPGIPSVVDESQQPIPPRDIPVSEPVIPSPTDQDRDGLTLDEEMQLGTSDGVADSDLDGLTDWDEVRVYKSNPLMADTDGDSYIDGHEVQNGYSPIGSGRLNEIPQQ